MFKNRVQTSDQQVRIIHKRLLPSKHNFEGVKLLHSVTSEWTGLIAVNNYSFIIDLRFIPN